MKAIMTGMTAGHLIAAILDGRAPPTAAAAAYHEWLADGSPPIVPPSWGSRRVADFPLTSS
jgi:hypothetical protein